MAKICMNESDKIKGKDKMDGDDSYKAIMLSHEKTESKKKEKKEEKK